MNAAELERLIEARVGRGRWFVPADVARGLRTGYARETLISRGKLLRRRIDRDDPRRHASPHHAEFEYRLE